LIRLNYDDVEKQRWKDKQYTGGGVHVLLCIEVLNIFKAVDLLSTKQIL
jgi:hypothetical protein